MIIIALIVIVYFAFSFFWNKHRSSKFTLKDDKIVGYKSDNNADKTTAIEPIYNYYYHANEYLAAATVCKNHKDWDTAIKNLNSALDIYNANKDYQVHSIVFRIASYLESSGKHKEAIETLEGLFGVSLPENLEEYTINKHLEIYDKIRIVSKNDPKNYLISVTMVLIISGIIAKRDDELLGYDVNDDKSRFKYYKGDLMEKIKLTPKDKRMYPWFLELIEFSKNCIANIYAEQFDRLSVESKIREIVYRNIGH